MLVFNKKKKKSNVNNGSLSNILTIYMLNDFTILND